LHTHHLEERFFAIDPTKYFLPNFSVLPALPLHQVRLKEHPHVLLRHKCHHLLQFINICMASGVNELNSSLLLHESVHPYHALPCISFLEVMLQPARRRCTSLGWHDSHKSQPSSLSVSKRVAIYAVTVDFT
jgi:hypothetical protein